VFFLKISLQRFFYQIKYNRQTQTKEGQMAEKSVKKVATKKPVAKKTVSKPAVAKKPAVKKAPVKKVAKAAAPVVETPVAETLPCGCNHGCACGGDCKCHKHCHGGFFKKLILILVIFALGFVAAKMLGCNKHHGRMPHPEFENGCMVVKCPKLAEMVPAIDVNGDGCVSMEEFKEFKHAKKVQEPTPAPQMAE